MLLGDVQFLAEFWLDRRTLASPGTQHSLMLSGEHTPALRQHWNPGGGMGWNRLVVGNGMDWDGMGEGESLAFWSFFWMPLSLGEFLCAHPISLSEWEVPGVEQLSLFLLQASLLF